jgi:hypothetical protein
VSLGRTPLGARTHQIIEVEYDGNGDPVYIGYAAPGTATSDALWLIFELTWTGGNMTSLRVAEGRLEYGSVWDDRASLSYS